MFSKKHVFLVGLLAVVVMLAGCTLFEAKPDVFIKVTSADQSYYGLSESYGGVNVYYSVKNIGEVDIDSMDLYFRVTTESGKVYEDTSFLSNLSVGEEKNGTAYIDTSGEKAVKVTLYKVKVELTDEYDYKEYEFDENISVDVEVK